jgi:hypothetical protein
MRGSVPVAVSVVIVVMPVRVVMVVRMIMGMRVTVGMPVVMCVIMPMIVLFGVMMVPVVVPMIVRVIVAAGAMVVGGLLGAEGPRHRLGGAARAAHQFRRARRHVEHLGADLGRDVAAAELPGEAQEPGRAARAHFQQRLLGGAHADKPPVLQAQRVAILQARGPLQGQIDAEPARRVEMSVALRAGRMIEGDRVDDLIGPDGGLADDLTGCGHGILGRRNGGGRGRRRPTFLQQVRIRWQARAEMSCPSANRPQSWPFRLPVL